MRDRRSVPPLRAGMTARSHRHLALLTEAAFFAATFVGSAATARAAAPAGGTAGPDAPFVAVLAPHDTSPESPGPTPRYIVRLRTRQTLINAVGIPFLSVPARAKHATPPRAAA